MKLTTASVRGFRRLENVSIDFEGTETVFVGPNNSGKTSATEVFRLFLKTGDFSIHDFSVSLIAALDSFGRGELDEKDLPAIELDLWFSLQADTQFGRIALLLPDAELDYVEVGIRLRYSVSDIRELRESYAARPTAKGATTPKKPLSHYLSLPGTLRRHFAMTYYALSRDSGIIIEKPLKPDEGRHALQALLRVDFIDAQRKIDDLEHAGSTRLSKLFTAYYRRNLTQAQAADEANDIIDKHNDDLTGHYAVVFSELLAVIGKLGVPSANDRTLRVISALVPETVLQTNATLTYLDIVRSHELPERYNGLGVKNLIYLAIQICEFHLSWIKTEENRPLALVLFIEEPECHLHAQAQQTFITNAWEIIREASVRCGEEGKIPQLVVTTHSSHILDTVDFANVRYFRRCHCEGEAAGSSSALNASKVLNLRQFKPIKSAEVEAKAKKDSSDKPDNTAVPEESVQAILDFLKAYLRLTHCDLFFADAAILVEGTVEKLLLPRMIEHEAEPLRQRYLTVLEVGGAFAHRFADLLEFISIPYVVITDIDSVDPEKNRSACRADTPGAVSSNGAFPFFLGISSIKDLVAISAASHYIASRRCYIAFQKLSVVDGYDQTKPMHGRTFEETFVYENIALFRDGTLTIGKKWEVSKDHESEYTAVHEAIGSSGFKKTQFALSLASSKAKWSSPSYIANSLRWLESELRPTPTSSLGKGKA